MNRHWSAQVWVCAVALSTLLAISSALPAAYAAIVTTGDVTPADSSTWTNNTNLTIANTADGAVSITGGSLVTIGKEVRLGTKPGLTGQLTVDGAGSTLTTQYFGAYGRLGVGENPLCCSTAAGNGIVTISNGGLIENFSVLVGSSPASTGRLTITNGGRLNGQLSIGSIRTSSGVVTVDGVGSQITGLGAVGDIGSGFLKVTNGASVTGTTFTVAGRDATSNSRAILDGPGSTLAFTGGAGVEMAITGVGLFTISNGGRFTMTDGGENTNPALNTFIGKLSSARGTVMVQGNGSTYQDGFDVNVGVNGSGRVSVADGASAALKSLTINNQSFVTVDLGTGSTMTSAGVLTNNGTLRMAAKATAANGTYAPISAGTWSGTGTVQALGGVYDPATHSVTVSNAATGAAGTAVNIDRSTTQRILITDGATGKQVGASFQAAIVPANLTLTASLMNNSQLSLLQGLLDPGKAILSAWDFSATGYTAGDPVYLSLQIGGGQKFYDLDVWHFDGTSWAKYLNTDLAYDNTFASFVATGFSGYAISGLAPVPVPAAMWLFVSGLAAMAGLSRPSFMKKA